MNAIVRIFKTPSAMHMQMRCFVSIDLHGGENISSSNEKFSCGKGLDKNAWN